MTTETKPRRSARQTWQIGDTVTVGFVSGLEVVGVVNPADGYARTEVVLWQPATDRFYRFAPHFGLSRCESLTDALAS